MVCVGDKTSPQKPERKINNIPVFSKVLLIRQGTVVDSQCYK